jgi:hypothetical protein
MSVPRHKPIFLWVRWQVAMGTQVYSDNEDLALLGFIWIQNKESKYLVSSLCLPNNPIRLLTLKCHVGRWWVTPVILATQEAEIRRIVVQSQPWANNFRDPISKKPITCWALPYSPQTSAWAWLQWCPTSVGCVCRCSPCGANSAARGGCGSYVPS